MRIALFSLALAAPLAFVSQPAPAQDAAAVSGDAIVRGDYSAAEHKLLAEMRIFPDRPELLLNLAAVYARTGRQAEARSLYMRVLGQDDVLMDIDADRTAGSHAIARKGLNRLERVQTAAY